MLFFCFSSCKFKQLYSFENLYGYQGKNTWKLWTKLIITQKIKIDFSSDSAHCTSSIKIRAKLRRGSLHILSWDSRNTWQVFVQQNKTGSYPCYFVVTIHDKPENYIENISSAPKLSWIKNIPESFLNMNPNKKLS